MDILLLKLKWFYIVGEVKNVVNRVVVFISKKGPEFL